MSADKVKAIADSRATQAVAIYVYRKQTALSSEQFETARKAVRAYIVDAVTGGKRDLTELQPDSATLQSVVYSALD